VLDSTDALELWSRNPVIDEDAVGSSCGGRVARLALGTELPEHIGAMLQGEDETAHEEEPEWGQKPLAGSAIV
jgi:hypothetical protein